MRRGSLLAVTAALLVPAAQPGLAQRDPGRAMRLGAAPSSAEDLRILARFSRCVAGRRANVAAAILAADPNTREHHSSARRLAGDNSSCAPSGTLKFSEVLFAGGLAEALLRRRTASADIAARTAHDPNRPPLQARDEAELMSLCTVRAAPSQIEALLASEAASAEEAAAIRALMPHVGECLTAGVNMRLNRPALRAALALATYRLVQHNAAAARP